MDWTTLLFSFAGRINRAKYFLAGVLYCVIWIVFIIVAIPMLGARTEDLLSFAGVGLLLWIGGVILLFATMWSGIAIGVKRLHDRDKSGWWIVLFYFAPSLLSGWQATATTSGGAMILGLASFVMTVWGFVELGCLRGTYGANRYGPDQLGGFSREPLR